MKFEHLLPAQPCVLCGAPSRNGPCCTACDADLPRLTSARCPVCALPTLSGDVCGNCLKQAPALDHTVAAFSYGFPLDKLIQSLKFRDHLMLVNYLADALAGLIDTKPDCLIA